MSRIAIALVAVALTTSGCTLRDRSLPTFRDGVLVTRAANPGAVAVGPGGEIFYAEGDAVSVVRGRREPVAFYRASGVVTSLATEPDGSLLVGAKLDGAATVTRVRGATSESIWSTLDDPSSPRVTSSGGMVIVGFGTTIAAVKNRQVTAVSDGWHDPLVVAGRGSRIWVADNAPRGEPERVARGRERNGAKRRRFATVLPNNSDPSGLALLVDEVLVCSRAHHNVKRLHIGLDDVARSRKPINRMICDNGIAAAPDGSIITATRDAIYRYPPR